MNISASVVSDGLENVWIALGGTTITLPSVASKSPSGVVNLTVPMAISVPSQGEVPDIGRSARTFDDEKTLVVKSMPVHGRSRRAFRQLKGHAADPVVGVAPILEDIRRHRTDLEGLALLLLTQQHRNWTSKRHFGGRLCV